MKTKRFSCEEMTPPDGPKNGLPRHVAIIMDGNGRWAVERGLPRIEGHSAGARTVKAIVRCCAAAGIPVLTLYAFSQENWKRPKEEVGLLMKLLDYFLDREIQALVKKGVRFQALGRLEALPPAILAKLRKATALTAGNRRLTLNLALNYGARAEILDAVSKILKESTTDPTMQNGGEWLTEQRFSGYLYTAGLPDPDLLIRTSGEMRLSNFLLWQLSYAEIYITKKYWPDFTCGDFMHAVAEYQGRERRFGDVRESC